MFANVCSSVLEIGLLADISFLYRVALSDSPSNRKEDQILHDFCLHPVEWLID